MPELPVSDVERAQHDYRDTLGCDIGWLDPDKGIGAVSRGKFIIFFRKRNPPFEPAVHWVFAEDIDALHSELKSSGANIVEPLEMKPWGLRQFAFEDLDGNRFYFHRDSPSTAPQRYNDESTMSNEQVAPETRGVTVKLLAAVDLGPEIEGMTGRQLRMRIVTIAPGGVFGPIHDHKERPGTVYILQGTITDHRNGVATDYGPGVGWPEDRNTTHWLENRGTIPAVEISVDIVRRE